MLWALHTMTWRGDSFLLRRLTPKFQNPCGHYGSRIAQHSCWSPPNKELNESLVYSQCRWSSAVSHMTGPLIACFTKSPCARFRYNLSLSNKPKTETWSATSVQPSMPLITARDERFTGKLFTYYYALRVGLKFDPNVSVWATRESLCLLILVTGRNVTVHY